MSLLDQKAFTIGDLARIALGTGELTNERVIILQNIFLVLLQKLNCHNETVKIKGLAAKCLQTLLNNYPSSCQYNLQIENVQGFHEKYQLLGELERRTQKIDAKIKRHIQQIRNRNRSSLFAANYWRIYASPTEDLGGLCLKENRKYWFLLENPMFNNEIRRQIVPQVLEKLEKFEHTIETMQKQLWKITQVDDETTDKLKYVGFIIGDIEELRSLMNSREKELRDAIAEVDEMLSCKLHRVTVPALKKYLEQRFDDANRHLRVLQLEAKKCPSTKPLLITDKKTCLSCSSHRNILRKFKNLKSIDESVKCNCCNLLKEPSVMEKIERMQNAILSDRPRKSKIISRFSKSDSKNPNTSESTWQKQEHLNTRLSEEASRKDHKVPDYGPPI